MSDRNRFGGVPGHVWVAQERIKYEGDYRERICDWLRANDINPNAVPANARASIANGQLTIPLKVQSANGHDVIDPSDNNRMLTHTVTVPVKVKPDGDVQLWLIPRCKECGR
jgi:hypothetical protein